MDNLKSNNNTENAVASFEYAYPSEPECDEAESNKSTPFYTPMEFLQTSFEFPSPTTEAPTHYQVKADDVSVRDASSVELDIYSSTQAAVATDNEDASRLISPKTFAFATPKQFLPRSPSVNRKYKRFSLYDRRSCSPQHLGPRSTSLQSATSCEERVDNGEKLFVDNKENAVPMVGNMRNDGHDGIPYLSNSGQNSPISLRDDTSNDANRLSYSPKLLASINNLNISGSPLSLINSAGYKNGNFFRFPEIDQVVQDCPCLEQPAIDASLDNQMRKMQTHQHIHDKIESTSPTTTSHQKFRQRSSEMSGITNTPPITDLAGRHHHYQQQLQDQQHQHQVQSEENVEQKPQTRLNRKNKNNLTIRIAKTPVKSPVPAPVSPLPTKPKTPTIKEKARSLDSATVHDNELSIVIQNVNESHGSFDEIDAQIPIESNTSLRNSRAANLDACLQSDRLARQYPVNSTSLSQLDTQGASTSTMAAMKRLCRRKSPGVNNTDWMSYHRTHYPYLLPQNLKIECNTAQSSLDSDVFDYSSDSPQRSGCDLKSAASVDSAKYGPNLLPAATTLLPRGMHKHNQLLHSSSTNLKTLPECLTLVEFSTANSPGPFKQKSMELPATHTTHLTHQPLMPARPASSSSSTNLLQRRGSNHSLTLNLHNSCGNLMNSGGGLSLSNYSLGSVNNFNSILNSKSTCNLDINAAIQIQGHPPPIYANNTNISQGSRQSLFRRRGSNHCITLKGQPSATSCVELNSLSHQNTAAVSVDQKYHLNCPNISRASSITTSTSNVPSNAATPKRGLLERRGSNQSFTLNMNLIGSSNQHLGDTSQKVGDVQQQQLLDQGQVCTCAASQTTNQRKFFSTENLNTNRSGTQQFYDYNSKQMCFGSASDLKPSEYSVESNVPTAAQEECMNIIVCTCAGGVRNIMTRPLSPQTTSEEFKIYLAGIQMLQSASNTLNQFDLMKFNNVFDNSYNKCIKKLIDPPILGGSRDAETPTSQQQTFTSEDSELQAIYQAIVEHLPSGSGVHQLDEEEQKRIFRDLHKEFWDLPLNHQEKPMVFGSQTKNRYKTILPNEHSRVQLESEVHELRNLENIGLEALDVTTSDIGSEAKKSFVSTDDAPYINANYVKGPDYVSKCYVATQGPMPNTIYDFWLMIYQNTQRYIRKAIDGGSSNSPHVDKHLILQQYYQKIIMLTNFTENNRQKCAIYFPIELNDILAVAAKQEIFQLSPALKEFFEPYLFSNTNEGANLCNAFAPMSDINSTSIAVESCKVKLSDQCLNELKATGNNFFLVKNIGIVRRNGYSIRKFVILYCIHVPNTGNNYHLQKIYCYHYWYPDWPDHQSPRDINTLLDTCLHVLNLGKCESEFDIFDDATIMRNAHLNAQRIELYKQDIFNAVQPLPVIHCSAGIGRTGCFTGILNAVRQLRQSLAYSLTAMSKLSLTAAAALQAKDCLSSPVANYDTDSSFTRNTLLHIKQIIHDEALEGGQTESSSTSLEQIIPAFSKLPKMPDIYVDILGIVCNLRLQRGGMVQNSEQYELLHRAVCLYLKRTLALRRF